MHLGQSLAPPHSHLWTSTISYAKTGETPASMGWYMHSMHRPVKMPVAVCLQTVPGKPFLSFLPSVPTWILGNYMPVKVAVSKRWASFWGLRVPFSLGHHGVLFFRVPRSQRLNDPGSPTSIPDVPTQWCHIPQHMKPCSGLHPASLPMGSLETVLPYFLFPFSLLLGIHITNASQSFTIF